MKAAADKTIRETLTEERRVDLLTKALDMLEEALHADKPAAGFAGEHWTARVAAANSLLDHLEFKPPTRIEVGKTDKFFTIKIRGEDDEDDGSE